jgi:signal transduction histidine kinase
VRGAVRALWSARSWRTTLHALIGLPVGVAGFLVVAGLGVGWAAALWSLIEGPTVAGGSPWPTGWWWSPSRSWPHGACGHAAPCSGGGSGPSSGSSSRRRPAPRGPGRCGRSGNGAAATWRQLAYHLLALVIRGAGGALVAVCWLALPLAAGFAVDLWVEGGPGAAAPGSVALGVAVTLAAPWVARGVAGVDEAAARALLGPGRAEELTLRVQSLVRSRAEIVAATDAERRRIERDLHDGAQQRLVSLAMHLGMARTSLTDAGEPARQAIAKAHDEAVAALAELRELVRGLHPAVLNDRGLDAALPGIVARAPLPVRLRVDLASRCSPSIEAVAYFVVSEALTNVAKHARASHCEVTVERRGDRLLVVVGDDGQGGAAPAGGSGLDGLAQRAAAVDGTLTIDSPPGGPTRITVELPCES